VSPRRGGQGWVPDRGDVIWIDHNPQAGRKMKDRHPFAVLSPASFHTTVGLVVGCAITSALYSRGSTFAVDLGPIPVQSLPAQLQQRVAPIAVAGDAAQRSPAPR
jgi:mRNA interferase MazF